METDEFRRLLDRVRQNDEAAAAELVAHYEPEIRTMVRAWLRPWEIRLRKVFDSNDICQSVLAWFFLKDAAKKYDLAAPDNLRRLFMVMVRNRVFYHARRQRTAKQTEPFPEGLAGPDPPPDQAVIEKDLWATIYSRLTAEEADLARRRIGGATWQEIAAAVGGSPDTLRIQLARATRRLAKTLSAVE